MRSFLSDFVLRSISLPSQWPFQLVGLALGNGPSVLEVLIASTETVPSQTDLRAAWKVRHAGRAAPLLLVVLYDGCAAICMFDPNKHGLVIKQ